MKFKFPFCFLISACVQCMMDTSFFFEAVEPDMKLSDDINGIMKLALFVLFRFDVRFFLRQLFWIET